MKTHNTHILQRLKRHLSCSVLIALLVSFTHTAEASTWSPTLLVNTESFQIIDDGSGDTDIELRFGDSANERFYWDISDSIFRLTDDLQVEGNLSSSGTLSIETLIKTDGNITLNSDQTAANATVTFGNDAGNETITFNDSTNQFELSDDIEINGSASGVSLTISSLKNCDTIDTDANGVLTCGSDATGGGSVWSDGGSFLYPGSDENVIIGDSTENAAEIRFTNDGTARFRGSVSGYTLRVSGDASVHGELTASGAVRADGNLTINDDQTAANSVLTFGNDAGNETLTFSDSTNNFELSDDIDVTGTVNATGNITTDANLTINEDNGGVNAVITFGNDAGVETITFNDTSNEFDISDDVNVTGTFDTTGNITTDANLTINEDNGAANAVLTFGNDAGAETITFNDGTNEFDISDDVNITGTLDTTGDATTDGTLQVNDDDTGNAQIIFGNDAGDETITFNDTSNEFDVSDDVNVSGTFDTTGNITTDANLTINEDADSNNAVLTFGSDTTNETLTWLNGLDVFQFSDDLNITGALSASGAVSLETTLNVQGAATFGSTVTLGGITYTWPGSAASASGDVLSVDPATGQLSWTSGTASSGSVVSLHPEYPNAVYFASGSTSVGTLSGSGGGASFENVYHWASTKSALNDYWVSTRVRIPDTFSSWDPTAPIEFRYRTGSSSATNNVLKVVMRDTADALVTLTGNEGLANTSFTTATITGPESGGTYTAGDYITFFIKLAANSSGYAEAGFIELNWETRD